MVDFAQALKQRKQVQPEPPQQVDFGQALQQRKQPKAGFFDFITGTSRETPETQALPEIGGVTTGGIGKDIKLAGGLLMALDDQEKIDVIKNIDEGATTREDEKGNVIVKFSNGQESILNKPGFSTQDALQIASQIAAFSPAAKMATFGKTLLQKVGLGALGAGATETAIQAGAQVAGSEQGFDPSRIALATGTGGVTETVGPAIKAVQRGRAVKQLGGTVDDITTPAELEAVEQLTKRSRDVSERTGISLTRPQQTGIESELTRQRTVGSLPAGARTAKIFLQKQSKQADEAVTEMLDSIAPPSAVETGAGRFREASQKAIEARKAVRSQKSDKLFNQAMREGAETNLDTTRETIKQKLKDAPDGGQLEKSLTKIDRLIGGENPSLKKLQNAKFEIDAMLDGSSGTVLGSTVKLEVAEVKRNLVKAMENASPTYKQANEAFAKASPAIKELEDSILGRVGAVSDTQLKSISGKIFDPTETNAQVIKEAKKVINSVDDNAWNQLLRVELEKRLGKVRANLDDVNLENVPSMLKNAIFGNTKQRNVLLAGVDGEAKRNLLFLEEALKRAAKGRPGGSDTALKQEAIAEFKTKGVLRGIVDFFTTPARTLTNAGDKAINNKKIKAVSKVLFDPDWTPKLKEIRKLTSKEKQRKAINDALVKAISSIEAKATAQALREQAQQE